MVLLRLTLANFVIFITRDDQETATIFTTRKDCDVVGAFTQQAALRKPYTNECHNLQGARWSAVMGVTGTMTFCLFESGVYILKLAAQCIRSFQTTLLFLLCGDQD